jgi:predicted permease
MPAHEHEDEAAWAITLAVISSVLKISLLIGVGIRLELAGILDDKKRKVLSALAMDVCLPCLMFASVLPEASVNLLLHGWELLLFPVVYVCVGAILGIACCLLVGTPTRHLGVAAACVAFPNVNGFPVSIVSALGAAIPNSPNGFSAMVYLSLVQITDGLMKYTIGPAILRRDRRAALKKGECVHTAPHLPLGNSLKDLDDLSPSGMTGKSTRKAREGLGMMHVETVPAFGLDMNQIRTVETDFGRQDSYALVECVLGRKGTMDVTDLDGTQSRPLPDQKQPLLSSEPPEPEFMDRRASFQGALSSAGTFFRQVCPPQVLAVLIALAIGAGPPWLKGLYVGEEKHFRVLGFVYGTTQQLGAGFVPLQMLSLGGRLVGIAGEKGPLAKKGNSGPDGPRKLWKISVAVLCARMVVSPIVLYCIGLAANRTLLKGGRPLAWWLPGLIVGACPTANNMSTMADMVGAGRSISAASTALQLILSPLILTVTLSFIITKTQDHLASDFVS